MSVKHIPAKDILQCDRCGVEAERGDGPFQNGGFHTKDSERWGRGYDGSAGGSRKDIDLCSSCANDFDVFLDNRTNVLARVR